MYGHELRPEPSPLMAPLTAEDAELVARLKRGDAAAARELYERHGGALLRFGMAMSNCRQTAEDLVHDTFVELLRQPGRFDPSRGSVQGYLFGIARHRLSRIARLSVRDTEVPAGGTEGADDAAEAGRTRTVSLAADETALAPWASAEDTGEALDRARNIELVRAAVFDLPRVHREVIALCDLEELPYATVATILGCPIGTVRSRLSRARALLATRLDVPDDTEEDERRGPTPGDALDIDASELGLSCRGTVT
jgi:RNA polymerase sigma-70 factor, ECF subfamily